MVIRTFGAVRGAGTQLRELPAGNPIEPGPRGIVGYTGTTERGPLGRIDFVPNRKAFERKYGKLNPAGPLATAAADYYGLAGGKGGAWVLRVTDGTEATAFQTLYSRHATPLPAIRVDGKTPGTWAGRRLCFRGKFAGGGLTETALDTGMVGRWAKNQLAGAQVFLDDAPGKSYRVVSNTVAGVVTVAADATMLSDVGGVGAATAGFAVGGAGPFAVIPGKHFDFKIDEGALLSYVFGGSRGQQNGAAGTFAAGAAGDSITLNINGTVVVVSFAATAGNVNAYAQTVSLALLNAGVNAVCYVAGGQLVLLSGIYGTASSVEVTAVNNAGGVKSGLIPLGANAGTATIDKGAGPVAVVIANMGAATRAELAQAINVTLGVTGGTLTVSGGLLKLTTNAAGAIPKGVQVFNLDGAAVLLGFDTLEHNGTAAGAAGFLTFRVELLSKNAWNQSKSLAVAVLDGADNPATTWGLAVYVDGELVYRAANLSSDPADPNYYLSLVNADPSNEYVRLTDLLTGDRTVAAARPANRSGASSVLSALSLTLPDPTTSYVPATALLGTGTVGAWSYPADLRRQRLTLTFTDATHFTVASDLAGGTGVLANGTVGVAYASPYPQIPGFTVSAGGVSFSAADVLILDVRALPAGELVGGGVYPDAANFPRFRARVAGNTARVVTVDLGTDLTSNGAIAAGAVFRLEWPEQAAGGADGTADVADGTYQTAYALDTSPWKALKDKGQGLVKLASPGVTSTLTQQAGTALAEALNYQYRREIPANVTDENAAADYISGTLGRSDYGVSQFPSYAQMQDPNPDAPSGAVVTRTITGLIQGREAAIAAAFNGYHKAEAGTDATLPGIIDLPAGLDLGRVLDDEILNPAGINAVLSKGGNWVLWGDRTNFANSAWKFKHQREQMSAYEADLLENFDWLAFQLNPRTNPNGAEARTAAVVALTDYFEAEWKKGALDGGTPEDGFSVESDLANNPPQPVGSDAAANAYADIQLVLIDTVERFVISIGATGLIERAA